ncbi:MAG: hypothetical protein RMK84_16900 [Oscillochloridaceae bacterium]|nr:hypothetical protein [Chloroflexaceae bacterium]MDW8391802.1 hypothetical protein [Oscillochloridaceae bacterium]
MSRRLARIRRWGLPLTLVVALALAVLGQAFAQPGPPGEPLLPNIEPEEALTADVPIWMLSEQEAVEATLRAYLSSDPLMLDEALALLEQNAVPSIAVLDRIATVYVPVLRRPPEVGQAPTPTPTPTPAPEPEPEPGEPADMVVTIWPRPSVWVARGGLLEYEFRLTNYGRGTARETVVVFPINRAQVYGFYTSLDSRAGDWVRSVDQNSITVVFGPLSAGARRSGKLFMRVNENLPLPSPTQTPVLIDTRASYTFRDDARGGGQRTNWAPVLVGSGPVDTPYIWVQRTPMSGPAGTRFAFFTNRFLPGEGVTTWLNTPGGRVQPLSLRGTANSEGSIELVLNSTGLAPGIYQIVLYGQRSGLTGVASFVVG